ncbi:exo-alpha-sialidase [Candidatus Nitrosocaldus cavascurensis]|uniref:exo-alpha-sialidase n=1 Tax=Candidatus Nitrosocaldus cavascurensis TaxID=2058097 RepID=UPI0015545180|nr:exo-alpha-sialidase [Candidatus Nitrosocaldus cavascurensis]
MSGRRDSSNIYNHQHHNNNNSTNNNNNNSNSNKYLTKLALCLASLLLLLITPTLVSIVYASDGSHSSSSSASSSPQSEQRTRFTSNILHFARTITISSNNTGMDAANPYMVAGKDGTIYIAWQQHVARNNTEIMLSMSIDNGLTFTKPVNISNTEHLDENPRLAVGDDGTLYIAWQSNVDGNYEIMLAQFKDGRLKTKPTNMSSNVGSSINPRLAVNNTNVYLAWQDNTIGNYEIMLRVSTDNGKTFNDAINISNNTGNSVDPLLVVDGSNVYIAWRDDLSSIKERRNNIMLRVSNDHGKTFSDTVNISKSRGDAINASMVAVNSNLYVVWQDNSSGNYEIMFRASSNSGSSFSNAVNLSNNAGNSIEPSIVASNGSVYIAWRDDTLGRHDIMLRVSTDNGRKFNDAINMSRGSSSGSIAMLPVLALDEGSNRLYIVWHSMQPTSTTTATAAVPSTTILLRYYDLKANTISGIMGISALGNDGSITNDSNTILKAKDGMVFIAWQSRSSIASSIMFRTNSWVSIDSTSSSMLRWGIDELSVSGRVNADSTDRILISWGDGSSDEMGIESIQGGVWNARHVYDSSAVGSRTITVMLLDKDGREKSSSSTTVNVVKHRTHIDTPVLESGSVKAGSSVKVTYTRLIDAETGEGVAGKVITYAGTALARSTTATTDSDGNVKGRGGKEGSVVTLTITDDSISSGTVYAVFAGDYAYEPSSSAPVRVTIEHVYDDKRQDRMIEFLVEDSNGESMYITVDGSRESELNMLMHILASGTDMERKNVYIGGMLEYYNNDHGFRFSPDTVMVLTEGMLNERDRDRVASNFKDIHDSFIYWKSKGTVYVQGKVTAVKESIGIRYQGGVHYISMASDGARLLQAYIEPDTGKVLLLINNTDRDRKVSIFIPNGLVAFADTYTDDGNSDRGDVQSGSGMINNNNSNDEFVYNLAITMNGGKSLSIEKVNHGGDYKEIRLMLPREQSTITLEMTGVHIIPEFPHYTAMVILLFAIIVYMAMSRRAILPNIQW